MNLFSPAEVTANYAQAGFVKAKRAVWKMVLLGVLAGFTIAMSCVVSSTAAHDIANVGTARIITGLIFAFGLSIVMGSGTELFTGNNLMVISVLEKKISALDMLKNWVFVYFGNMLGALLVAAGCAFLGQLNYTDGGLAVYTIKLAAAKSSLSFSGALVYGIFCNVLVCLGVFIA
ncbi:MAG: formate/nitrite transporter family protein, partial [Elusimicrobiota bacterium]|nr:formate/nitrite transporter family protein [Elusimicrobiota bacterium]